MKTKLYSNSLLCCALALTAACSNDTEEILAEQQNAPQEVTLSFSVEGGDTRTFVYHDYNYGNDNEGYYTYWVYGDDIYVWGYKNATTSTPYAYGTLTTYESTGGSGSSSAQFKGLIWGGGSVTDLQYALYPAPETNTDNTSFTYTLKSEYDFTNQMSDISPMPDTPLSDYDFIAGGNQNYYTCNDAPMGCVISTEIDPNGGYDKAPVFSNLCGMVRLKIDGYDINSIYNIYDGSPSGSVGTVTVTVTADKDIAGTAKVTLAEDAFTLTMDNGSSSENNKTVTFKNIPADIITSTDHFCLDFPVPPSEGDVEYTITMTYSQKNSDDTDDTTATETIYEGRHTIGVSEIWIPTIGLSQLTFRTTGYTEDSEIPES